MVCIICDDLSVAISGPKDQDQNNKQMNETSYRFYNHGDFAVIYLWARIDR